LCDGGGGKGTPLPARGHICGAGVLELILPHSLSEGGVVVIVVAGCFRGLGRSG